MLYPQLWQNEFINGMGQYESRYKKRAGYESRPTKSFSGYSSLFIYFFFPPFPQLHFLHTVVTSCNFLYFTQTQSLIAIIKDAAAPAENKP
jgi:hypothetical protein